MTYHDFVMNNLETLLLFSVLTGGLAAFVAKRKEKDPLFWFFIGALFGMIGVFIVLFFPSAKKEQKLAYAGPEVTEIPQSMPSLSTLISYEWYYLEADETQVGPVRFFELQEKWHDKEVHKDTLVWNSSLSDWTTISALPNLETGLAGKQ